MDNLQSTQRLIAILFLGSSVLSITVALIAARHRQGVTWRYFIAASACIALWCCSDALFFLAAPHDAARWFWMTASYCAQVACVPIVFSFALYFSRLEHWLTPGRKVLLWTPFVVAIVLALTNPWHGLIWETSLSPTAFKSGPGHGLYFFLMLPVSYGLVLLALGIFTTQVWHVHKLYKQQAILLFLGVLLPLASSVLYFTPFNPFPGVDLAPASFAVTWLLLLYSTTHLHLLDLRPIYRDAVFERMSDGAVILDAHGRIIDVNPAAQQFLAAAGRTLGDDVQATLASCFAVEAGLDLSPGASYQLLTREQPPRHFDLQTAAVGRRASVMLVWRDTTRLHLALATMEAQERFMARQAGIDADFKREVDLAVEILQAQVQAALDHLDRGQTGATAALLLQVSNVTAENLRRRTLAFYETRLQSTEFFMMIGDYVAHFAAAHNLQPVIQIDPALDADQLGPTACMQIVHILQEALENVGRHARAQQVTATFMQTPGGVVLTVRDDGVGFDPRHVLSRVEPTGLASMQWRAQLGAGRLSITAAPGAGVEVSAAFPYARTDVEPAALDGKRALLAIEPVLDREGLRALLVAAGATVALPALQRAALLAAAKAERPDLILIDIDLAELIAPRTLHALRRTCAAARIIILAADAHPKLPAALHSGADGYLLKTLPSDVMMDALVQLATGARGLAPHLSTEIVRAYAGHDDRPPDSRQLTERQTEIVTLIGQNLTYVEIAARLGVSERTVRYHADQIRRRLGLVSHSELALYARRHRST